MSLVGERPCFSCWEEVKIALALLSFYAFCRDGSWQDKAKKILEECGLSNEGKRYLAQRMDEIAADIFRFRIVC
jgi:hypothetical protein